MYLGDFPVGGVVDFNFTSRQFTTGQPFLLAGTPLVRVYKSSGTTEDDSGITLTTDFDSVTGLNHVTIDLSADGTFYAAGSECSIVLTAGTVDGVSVAGETLAHFSIERAGGVLALAKGANGFTAIKDAVDDTPGLVWDVDYSGHLTPGSFGNVVANLPDAATTAYTVWQADPAGWSSSPDTFGKLAIDTYVTAALIKPVTDKLDTAMQLDGIVYQFTANALENAPSGGLTAADVWTYGTRELTAGTNIVLAKGTGITGFNDLSSADVEAAADAAILAAGVDPTVMGRLDIAVSTRLASASYTTPPTAAANAEALLKYDMSAITGEASRSPLNALRILRNRMSTESGDLVVYKEDDTTEAWTAALTTSSTAIPITGTDPT